MPWSVCAPRTCIRLRPVQDLPTIEARVELVEALGSGVMAHFHVDVDAYRAIEARGAGPADDGGDDDLGGPLGGALAAQPNLVAHFPPRVELRLADTVPVAIDPGALHFFDEETGAALRVDGSFVALARGHARVRGSRRSRSRRATPKPPVGAALDALAKPPTYSAFASQRIYFVMPDRYANGDPSNDRGGLTGPRSVTGYDPADPGWYHGGDLKGLTGACTDTRTGLARIKELGFTAIWVTPVVAQQYVQADSAAYHGYWGLDFTRVDPHLGTNADFAAFVDCAHSLRMKVYLDVVVNHTADVIIPAGGSTFRGADEVPYRDCKGKPFSAQRYAGTKRFPCLSSRYQPRQPLVLPQNRGLKKPAWLNEVTRYHNRGDITFDSCSPACFEQGDFFGLDDIFTEQPFVVNGLAEVFGDWIRQFKVDGFRVDTAKHVDRAFFRALGAEDPRGGACRRRVRTSRSSARSS